MSALTIRPDAETRWDCVALGEVMLRFDPGETRISRARSFDVWEGGGEYNVARGLRRCFGMRTTVVTALVDNPVGRLIEDLMLQGGVDQSHVIWREDDGVGRLARNGLNFTERGFGIRPALGCSDRGLTAVSQLAVGDVDWEALFGDEGARWLHTGGIYAALSAAAPQVAAEAMRAARRHGTIVSYDLNYRPSLWRGLGGPRAAQRVNRQLAGLADVLLGNEEDFTAALGYEVEGTDESLAELDHAAYARMAARVLQDHPNVKMIATTLRHARSATRNDWSALLVDRERLYRSRERPELEILDRVGGGDSFAAGLVYATLEGSGPQAAVDWGAAHGALAMTTPGDTSMATRDEVARAISALTARVAR